MLVIVNFVAINFSTPKRIIHNDVRSTEKGQMAEITGYTLGNAAYRAKLLAPGMTRGTQVKILNVAPLGDP